MKTKTAGPVAALGLGLAIALAANLTYAVPRGPVVVGLGLVAPLVLPVVLYLRTTFTPRGFWQRTVREAATLAVAGPAVAVSYVHTFELVSSAHEPWILAVLAPLSSDGLAGLATLALHRLRQAQTEEVVKARQKAERASRPKPPRAKPDPAPEPEPVEAPLDDLAPTRAQIEQIMADEGCSRRTAYRRLKALRDTGVA